MILNRIKLLLVMSILAPVIAGAESNMKLWYSTPAENWNEALPLGNGRIGAMVFGVPCNECIQLNEATFWSGSPYNNYRPGAIMDLQKIRQLQFDGKFEDAKDMVDAKMLSKNSHGMMFEPVGNIRITMSNTGTPSSYKRELDLRTAVNTTTFTVGGVTYKRECFISYPDNVLAMRISCDKAGSMNAVISMDTQQKNTFSRIDAHTMLLQETSPELEKIEGKVLLNAYLYLDVDGGLTLNVADAVKVKRANAITLYLAMRTNYQSYRDLSADPQRALQELRTAVTKGYDELKTRHIADFSSFIDRSALLLPGDSTVESLPTDERLANYQHDKSLPALFYHFGRYLLLSGSRPGGQPTNLQGLWNGDIRPDWDSKYTININTEMNYWPAEVTNLSETTEPLMSMLDDLSETGKPTAAEMYGAHGWVTHHNTDLWRSTGIVDGASFGAWPYGGAWLAQHIWYHYLYTGDLGFLKKHYSVLRGCAEFLCDFLIREPEHGWMVGAPSVSPENSPKNVTGNKRVNYGCTIDNEIAYDVFSATVQSAEALHVDKPLIARIKKISSQLPPLQIGQYGQLQEWMWDWDSNKENQSHASHTYGLFPSNIISYYRTPLLAAAVRNTLLQRNETDNTSWGNAWRVNLWARLHNGAKALYFLNMLMRPATAEVNYSGSMKNMFSSIMALNGGNPCFQIDANYGLTSGIAEMLMQSQDGAIDILPALPKEWSEGKLKGFRGRGGFDVSIEWKDNKVSTVTIKSTIGGKCKVRSCSELVPVGKLQYSRVKGTACAPKIVIPVRMLNNSKTNISPVDREPCHVISFDTEAGGVYTLKGL